MLWLWAPPAHRAQDGADCGKPSPARVRRHRPPDLVRRGAGGRYRDLRWTAEYDDAHRQILASHDEAVGIREKDPGRFDSKLREDRTAHVIALELVGYTRGEPARDYHGGHAVLEQEERAALTLLGGPPQLLAIAGGRPPGRDRVWLPVSWQLPLLRRHGAGLDPDRSLARGSCPPDRPMWYLWGGMCHDRPRTRAASSKCMGSVHCQSPPQANPHRLKMETTRRSSCPIVPR